MSEAAAEAEAIASTSQRHSGHLDTLWNQCQELKAEITTLTHQAHQEIVALMLSQEGSRDGVKALSDEIYNDVANTCTKYKAELRDGIRTECSGLSNAIVKLRKDFGSELNSLKKDLEDDEKYSGDLNEAQKYWKKHVKGLELQVKSLQATALVQAVLIEDLRENPKAGVLTTTQVDSALDAQMQALTDRVDRYAVRCQRQEEKVHILESGMYKCGKEQAGYRFPNPNSRFDSNSNLKNNNEESDSGEEEEEEVPVQTKTERTPNPSSDSAPVAKDMKFSDVEMFNGTSTALQGFLDHLDTIIGMKPASFPVGEHRKRIMYISLRYKCPASNWFTAMNDMQWISYDHWVGEFKRNLDNPHARDDAIQKIERAVQRSGLKTEDCVPYMRAPQLEAKLSPDNLWPSL